MTEPGKPHLRLLTYLCPDLPLSFFSLVRDVLEEATHIETEIIVEDRFTGPQVDRANPFTDNRADIVAVHSTDFLRLVAENQADMELCPAAPVFKHSLNKDKAVYFSEIIIHASNKEKYKTIADLKGCSWAYNNPLSLSGNVVILDYLKKKLKTNATFFGNIVESGSHLASINMVKEHRVIASGVDSIVLAEYLRDHPEDTKNVTRIASLGPLPVFPLLFNSKLSDKVKHEIVNALLTMETKPLWASRLQDVGVVKFISVTLDLFNMEKAFTDSVSGMSINEAYY
ncbi:unnamed protein product [Lymnaea stagnalis]|uniref:Uncharacterized protein n=1 Tax=Lymnaea stagnalis TaxID=6523 RepID=A0AAV2I684_LYMST